MPISALLYTTMRVYWLRQIIHPTWHFTALCAGILGGVVLSGWWRQPSVMSLIVGISIFALAVIRHRRFLLVFAFIAGILIGNWRGSMEQLSYDAFHSMYGKHVRIEGAVKDDIETNARKQVVVHLSHISSNGQLLKGTVWVTLTSLEGKKISRGDTLELDGVLRPGFGSYAASMYIPEIVKLKKPPIHSVALAVRNDFARHVELAIKDPEASLGVGFLLGQKRGLPSQLVEALQVAGLTHIVVASGYNLTILVRLARRMLERVSKYLATLTGACLIAGFIAMTGLSPSMTRAGLVTGLGLWAWYWGRRFHPITLLATAMAATVLWSPSYLWGDIGWALSFAAFGGVVLLAPLIQAYFYGQEKPSFITQLIIETLSAQLATAPIILLVFGQFSNIALLSNLLILPFIPLAMLLVAVAGTGAYAFPAFSHIFGWPAEKILSVMVWVIEKTAAIDWAQSSWRLSASGVVIWYLTLAAAGGYIIYRTRFQLRRASVVE